MIKAAVISVTFSEVIQWRCILIIDIHVNEAISQSVNQSIKYLTYVDSKTVTTSAYSVPHDVKN